MTTKEQLLALAERVEQATGPDRELDALSHFLTNRKWIGRIPTWPPAKIGRPAMEDGLTMHIEGDGYFYGDEVPLYTASLDAAMSLVPADHMKLLDLELSWEPADPAVHPACSVRWYPPFKEGPDWHALVVSGRTPALALTAAALCARAHALEVPHVTP